MTALSLFKGEITADAVTARASAGTGLLRRGRQRERERRHEPGGRGPAGRPGAVEDRARRLGAADDRHAGRRSQRAPPEHAGYRGFVTELDVRLTADHGGLPASSEIQIGYAEAAAQTAPPRHDDGHDHDHDRDRAASRRRPERR